jgi:type I restriction enzyme S subunit
MVRLGDVAEISSGGTPSRSVLEYWQNGTIPWVKIGDIKEKYISRTGEMITELGLKNSSAKIIPKGALLYTIFATLGEVGILNIDATTNQAIAGIQFSDIVNPNYAYYFLKSLKKSVEAIGRGVAQNNINQYILKNILIPLPPLDEQKRIADVLDKASELIKKRKEQIRLMDELAKSLFIEMFGDPVENPMGWNVKKLGDLAHIETGGTPARINANNYSDTGIPWVKTGEIAAGYILSTEERITELGMENSNCKLLPVNTILLAMYGQGITRGKVGLLKIVATTNQACAAILPNESYSSEYLLQLLDLCYNNLRELSRGGNQPNLNLTIVKEYNVPLAPLLLQNEFADRIDAIEQQKALLQNGLTKMETAYKALMQEYFG